jgi:hypothetical protein
VQQIAGHEHMACASLQAAWAWLHGASGRATTITRSVVHAGVNTNLKLWSKAGTSRKTQNFPDSQVYTWKDFSKYGYTRSLSSRWFFQVP